MISRQTQRRSTRSIVAANSLPDRSQCIGQRVQSKAAFIIAAPMPDTASAQGRRPSGLTYPRDQHQSADRCRVR